MLFYLILLFTLVFPSAAISSNNTPCGGPTDLLSFVDRPTIGDSACVAPEKSVVLESGYEYLRLLGGGNEQDYPEALLRFGLANRFEFNIFLPNSIHQTVFPYSGFEASSLGLKHELGSSSQWVTAIDGYILLPSGSANFGDKRVGGNI